jgi:hypothetical protein
MAWPAVFGVVALFMLPGLILSAVVSEPSSQTSAPKSLSDAISQPFLEFVRREGVQSALWVLAFILFYKLGDGMATALSSVFYKEEACETRLVEEESCCAKPQTTHKDCCSDKKVNLKNKTEKIIIKTISLDFEPAFFSAYKNQTLAVVEAQCFSKETTAFYCESNAPPRYKLYCQYTFYD